MTNASYSLEHIEAGATGTYSPEDLESFTAVEEGGFEIGSDPMISEGFCNCIALIGLSKRVAVLGHFQQISVPGLGSYDEFGDAIRALADFEAHTVILAAGGVFDNPVGLVDYTTADRAFAEQAVRASLPSSELVIDWNEARGTCKDIVVFPEFGKVAIHPDTFE